MAQKDIKLKELLSDPIRFADLFNGALFGGKKVLKPNDLSTLPTELAVTIDDNIDNMVSIPRFRDIIKKYANGTEFVILACENQTNINYTMNLLCITDIEDLNIYKTDIREFFVMLKYSSDIKQMKEYIASNKDRLSNIDNPTYGTISAFLDNKNYLNNIKNKVQTEKGGYNMCIAFDQMVEEGIEIGIERGKLIEAQKIAFSLIDVLDIQTISEKTGLSIEEIKELRQ